MALWKGKTMGRVKKVAVSDQGGGRDEHAEHRRFLGQVTIPYDTIMVDTGHHTFVKTCRPRVNPNGNQ